MTLLLNFHEGLLHGALSPGRTWQFWLRVPKTSPVLSSDHCAVCSTFNLLGRVDSANKTPNVTKNPWTSRWERWCDHRYSWELLHQVNFVYNTGVTGVIQNTRVGTTWDTCHFSQPWTRPLHRCGTPKWGVESVQLCDPSSRPGLPHHLRLLRKACSYQAHSPRPQGKGQPLQHL